MKKNYKNIFITILGGIIGIALFVSLSGAVQARTSFEDMMAMPSVFTSGGGTIGLSQMQMARKLHDTQDTVHSSVIPWTDSVLNSNNEKAIFRLAGSSMFSNILSFGQTRFDTLAVGFDHPFVFNTGAPKLQVDGYITIKDLAHNDGKQVKACINDFGKIVACAATSSYHCTGETPTNADLCNGDDQDLTQDTPLVLTQQCSTKTKCEYVCSKGYHFVKGNCVIDEQGEKIDGQCGKAQGGEYTKTPPESDLCGAGTASAVTDKGSSYTWTCSGSNGGANVDCVAKHNDGKKNGGEEKKGLLYSCNGKDWDNNKKDCSSVNYDAKKTYTNKDTVCVDEETAISMDKNGDPDGNCGE